MITIKSDFKAKEFSCSVPDVVFTTSEEYADVVITATKDGESNEIFNERLYPDSTGTIEVVEMDRLIEAYAEQWLVFTLTVRMTDAAGASSQLSTQVVSCKAMMQNITAVDFCNTRFLTLLDGKRQTADGWLES